MAQDTTRPKGQETPRPTTELPKNIEASGAKTPSGFIYWIPRVIIGVGVILFLLAPALRSFTSNTPIAGLSPQVATTSAPAAPIVAPNPNILGTERRTFSFDEKGVTLIVGDNPNLNLCLSPLPDDGNYTYTLSDGTVWSRNMATGPRKVTGTAALQSPGGNRSVVAWLCSPSTSQ